MKIRKICDRPGRALGLAMLLAGNTVLAAGFETKLFPVDGKLEANIRRTTGGVPHITADNLKSAAFGHGYAQAQDNVCLLAEAIVKARSERSKYFGPGPDAGFGVGPVS